MTIFGNGVKASKKINLVTTTKIDLAIQVRDVEHASTRLAHYTHHASA